MSKPPMIFESSITGQYFMVTAYKDLGEGKFKATGQKHDVTEYIEHFKKQAVTQALDQVYSCVQFGTDNAIFEYLEKHGIPKS